MDEQSIKSFILSLDVEVGDLRVGDKWVNMKCPLAPYLHSSGTDSRPSFGISISEDSTSVYYCFGCTPEARPLGWLLHNFYVLSGAFPTEAAKIYMENEIFEEEDALPKFSDPWFNPKVKVKSPVPPEVLRRYPLLQYSHSPIEREIRHWLSVVRGVPEWVQNMCQLRHNPENRSVVFPLTDFRGNVMTMRERVIKTKHIWTVSPKLAGYDGDFTPLKTSGAWFGLALVDWRNPVIVVEGEIDAMRLMALGYSNVIASATSSVTDAQIDAIGTDTLLLGGDADKAGRKMIRKIKESMQSKAVLFKLLWSVAKKSNGEPCNDAGDLPNDEELQKVLDMAELI